MFSKRKVSIITEDTESLHFRNEINAVSCSRARCQWCKERSPEDHCPTDDTKSPETMRIIHSWLSSCVKYYDKCGEGQEYVLPKRIVEIVDHNSAQCRLPVTNNSQTDQYACLSHRWYAETETASLKRDDLDEFQERIPQERLYPLLRDAIQMACELGLK